MFTPREQRYLAVALPIGIVLAVLVDAIVLAAAGTGGLGVPGPGGPGSPPPPPPFILGPATVSISGNWVLFPVENSSTGVPAVDIALQLTNASGGVVTLGATASVRSGDTPLATWDFTAGEWVAGGNASIQGGDGILVTVPDVLGVVGGTLLIEAGGTSVGYPIPY